ncbi:MAG: hypothetical protein Kow0019_00600 [Methanobacteriaceae archaeon]
MGLGSSYPKSSIAFFISKEIFISLNCILSIISSLFINLVFYNQLFSSDFFLEKSKLAENNQKKLLFIY